MLLVNGFCFLLLLFAEYYFHSWLSQLARYACYTAYSLYIRQQFHDRFCCPFLLFCCQLRKFRQKDITDYLVAGWQPAFCYARNGSEPCSERHDLNLSDKIIKHEHAQSILGFCCSN